MASNRDLAAHSSSISDHKGVIYVREKDAEGNDVRFVITFSGEKKTNIRTSDTQNMSEKEKKLTS